MTVNLASLLVLASDGTCGWRGLLVSTSPLETHNPEPRASVAPTPLGAAWGQPTAAGLKGLRWTEALLVTVHAGETSMSLIHICRRAASFPAEMRSTWVGGRAPGMGASDTPGGH